MLTPELAKKQLEAWSEPEGLARFVPLVAKLPKKLRPAGYTLLGRMADGGEQKDWQLWVREREAAFAALDQGPAGDRLTLFKLLFPACPEAIDRGWQFLTAAPYQQSYARRPFRAPHLPEVTLDLRSAWLAELMEQTALYQSDIVTPAWLATWANYLGNGYGDRSGAIGRLLAAVIDGGGKSGDEVFEILRQSALNEHEIGAMGRHVTRALLLASRADGWELMEKMLLAAQRQEGLRQVILETVDESHPTAFRRMLKLIRRENLARFSAVVRAVNVWFGLNFDSATPKTVNESIDRAISYLDDEAVRRKALEGKDAEDAFSALWSIAYDDVAASIAPAEKLLKHPKPEFRYVATYHLSQASLNLAIPGLIRALADDNLHVAFCAINGLREFGDMSESETETPERKELRQSLAPVYKALEGLFHKVPEKPVSLKPIVWPWTGLKPERSQVVDALIRHLGSRPPTVLLPYIPALTSNQRANLVRLLAEQKKWDRETRETLVTLVGDAGPDVRAAAVDALLRGSLQKGEAERLESYLTRTSTDLRQGVLKLLLQQSDTASLASARRLIVAKNGKERLAGLELLRHLAVANRQRATCHKLARDYQSEHTSLSRDEQTHLEAIASSGQPAITRETALGLIDPADRTPVMPPSKRKVEAVTAATVKCIQALDDLIHQHRETSVKLTHWNGTPYEALLGSLDYGFPGPDWNKTPEENRQDLPLAEVWETWWLNRPRAQIDADGLVNTRALTWLEVSDEWEYDALQAWIKKSPARRPVGKFISGGFDPPKLRYGSTVQTLLTWMGHLHPASRFAIVDLALDVVETVFSLIPQEDVQNLSRIPLPEGDGLYDDWEGIVDWRQLHVFNNWIPTGSAEDFQPAQMVRRWQMLRWWEEPVVGAPRRHADFDVLKGAYLCDGATQSDIYDALLGVRASSLGSLTWRKLGDDDRKFLADRPEVAEILDRCRERILEIELARGDAPTMATPLAWQLQSLWSIDVLVRILTALGNLDFKNASRYRYAGQLGSRAEILSYLASVVYPLPGEMPEQFAVAMKTAVAEGLFPEHRLLELAFLAPQWSRFIERYFQWPGYTEGLYWFLAHMRYVYEATDKATVGTEAEAAAENAEGTEGGRQATAWERLILERTPLSDNDRQAGAIDVAWFRRTYQQLNPKRWQALADAARFAATGPQARRAKFIGDVLLGQAKRKELIDGVKTKRLKDHVRLLGLLPLAAGAKREADLVERYRALQDYRRYARTLSSMSKPDALRAVEIGMQNLASTADYPDPLRLEWAMEADSVRDLASGSVTVEKGDVAVTLAFDERFEPQLTVTRDDKPLKSIPPAVKKEKAIAALAERLGELKKQASQVRWSLETSMCRGDELSGAELAQLSDHALLSPLLQRLVLIGDGAMGYLDRQGKSLRDHAGKKQAIKKGTQYRIAHPADLLKAKDWSAWQHECFHVERLQPFKQVFRELYVVTRQEAADAGGSSRYAGQQVNEKQALAL
jgi:HEAT repeat protein